MKTIKDTYNKKRYTTKGIQYILSSIASSTKHLGHKTRSEVVPILKGNPA